MLHSVSRPFEIVEGSILLASLTIDYTSFGKSSLHLIIIEAVAIINDISAGLQPLTWTSGVTGSNCLFICHCWQRGHDKAADEYNNLFHLRVFLRGPDPNWFQTLVIQHP